MKVVFTMLIGAAVLMTGVEARAQLFRDQALGRTESLRKRSPGGQDARLNRSRSRGSDANSRSQGGGQGDAEPLGTILGNERFLRGNRDARDFVGTDSGETRRFVGVQQALQADAAERPETPPPEIQIEPASDPNRVQLLVEPSGLGIYRPRLSIDFEFPTRPAQAVSLQLAHRLQTSLQARWSTPIEVSVEGETATLRGTVASERDRTLARLLVLFEPGISKVENELTVAAGLPDP